MAKKAEANLMLPAGGFVLFVTVDISPQDLDPEEAKKTAWATSLHALSTAPKTYPLEFVRHKENIDDPAELGTPHLQMVGQFLANEVELAPDKAEEVTDKLYEVWETRLAGWLKTYPDLTVQNNVYYFVRPEDVEALPEGAWALLETTCEDFDLNLARSKGDN